MGVLIDGPLGAPQHTPFDKLGVWVLGFRVLAFRVSLLRVYRVKSVSGVLGFKGLGFFFRFFFGVLGFRILSF
jgi:hypothetical protein